MNPFADTKLEVNGRSRFWYMKVCDPWQIRMRRQYNNIWATIVVLSWYEEGLRTSLRAESLTFRIGDGRS